MIQQLSFLAHPAPPPAPPYIPTSRDLQSVTAADLIVDLLEGLGESEAADIARSIAAQARLHPALAWWAVGGADAQILTLEWPWKTSTRLARLQDMQRTLNAILATRCPTCASAGIAIDMFGRTERVSEFQSHVHCVYRWRCRACGSRWDEHMDALSARAKGGAS